MDKDRSTLTVHPADAEWTALITSYPNQSDLLKLLLCQKLQLIDKQRSTFVHVSEYSSLFTTCDPADPTRSRPSVLSLSSLTPPLGGAVYLRRPPTDNRHQLPSRLHPFSLLNQASLSLSIFPRTLPPLILRRQVNSFEIFDFSRSKPSWELLARSVSVRSRRNPVQWFRDRPIYHRSSEHRAEFGVNLW